MQTKSSDNVQQFLAHVKEHTKAYGIKLVITKYNHVNLGHGVGRASGYFDQSIIKVAGGGRSSKRILELIVHEYSHFLQFIHQEEIWKKAGRHNLEEALFNKKVTKERFHEMVSADKELEIDAEKKSVEIIKKWNLPIDVETYIKGANAYIYYYTYMDKYRKWCIKAPSRVKKIIDIMSVTFRKNYDKLPEDYEKLINKYCV